MNRFKRLAAAMLLFSGTLTAIGQPAAQAVAAPVAVTVNTRAGLAIMPETGLGINDAIWDTTLGTAEVADLLGAAGVKMRRYPGGSYSDIYHWESHTAPGGYVAPNTDFDTFMAGVRRTGAQPMIVANYGTGTPAEAAGWVRHANLTKGYGVKYWTIGNENYGNGHYGATWEADDHADKSPNQYASLVVEYADAMKAVDPTIKVGAVLTMPGNWPDAITAGGDAGSWNQVVLAATGSKIDFVDVHWYPGGSAPSETLSKPEHIADAMYLLRQQIARHAGAANASRIGISMTELNVGAGRNTQPGALFLAETYTGLLEQGLFTVQWWNVHNGIEAVSTIGGQTDYQDFGLLSSGTCLPDGVTCEPALNTPFAPYHGLAMVSRLARPGDQFVRAATDQPLVTAHAARKPNGDLTVLLSNRDPDNSYPVNLSYAGYAPAAGAPLVHTYANGAAGITTARAGTATSQTLPPYSMMVIELRPQSTVTGPPSAPGQPTATSVTDTSATISWPAGGAGAHPVAKHEVYRQLGAVSEQLGETPGASFTVHNLRPGTRYTVNVLTRDTAGKVSWASPPLTFTTGAPLASTCNVRWSYATDWGNGYVASIDITNTGTSPVDGWTLTYAWPTTWQRLDNGWNGTWAQDAGRVTVTPADWNRRIEPGATANVGFVGVYAGPNVQPILFTVNGMLCSTN